MGTHPIFESDFDCLTDDHMIGYDKIIETLGGMYLERDWLRLSEVKYCWIVAFGYKPTKTQLGTKFNSVNNDGPYNRQELYSIIKQELKYVDNNSSDMGIMAIKK